MITGQQQGMSGGGQPAAAAPGLQQAGGIAGGQQPSNLQLTYEQFQAQIRQNQQREEMMARQALLQAGADNFSERLRALASQLDNIRGELSFADNQLTLQMDAQRRQFAQVMQRIGEMQAALGELMRTPREQPLQPLRQPQTVQAAAQAVPLQSMQQASQMQQTSQMQQAAAQPVQPAPLQ